LKNTEEPTMRIVGARARGFALVELGVVGVVAIAVAALLLLTAGDQRRLGRLGEDVGKLRHIGALTGQYAADHADRFWTFSWRKGDSLSQYPDLNNAPDDNQAAANQAVDILRRRAGREDIAPITAWSPYKIYSHLPLAEHGGEIPDEIFISSMDGHRLKWARDPFGFDAGAYTPAPSTMGTNSGKRWPYGGSFQVSAAFFDKSTPPNRMYQGGTHNNLVVPSGAVFGGRLLAEVAHPSHKAHLSDTHGRHFGAAHPFATHREARLPFLFCDGSVLVRSAAEANLGWTPNTPTSGGGTSFLYSPEAWEPATFSGSGGDFVEGRFLWTRGTATESGIKGRDFGKETCSGQAPCD
jgi:hypothetical protein